MMYNPKRSYSLLLKSFAETTLSRPWGHIQRHNESQVILNRLSVHQNDHVVEKRPYRARTARHVAYFDLQAQAKQYPSLLLKHFTVILWLKPSKNMAVLHLHQCLRYVV